MARPPRYKFTDTAQQIVGGFLLAGPFVVTEEVWVLAREMSRIHALATVALVAIIGYGTLYHADDDRDPDHEADVGGFPIRFLSLLIVAFGSVLTLVFVLNAPETFLGVMSPGEKAEIILKVVAITALFSIVGAATADTVF